VAEWLARAYRIGRQNRAVVEGLLLFEVERLAGVEETIATAILDRPRMTYPSRAKPWPDPSAERVMESEVAVRPSAKHLKSHGKATS
jgi:hypothetical protein